MSHSGWWRRSCSSTGTCSSEPNFIKATVRRPPLAERLEATHRRTHRGSVARRNVPSPRLTDLIPVTPRIEVLLALPGPRPNWSSAFTYLSLRLRKGARSIRTLTEAARSRTLNDDVKETIDARITRIPFAALLAIVGSPDHRGPRRRRRRQKPTSHRRQRASPTSSSSRRQRWPIQHQRLLDRTDRLSHAEHHRDHAEDHLRRLLRRAELHGRSPSFVTGRPASRRGQPR